MQEYLPLGWTAESALDEGSQVRDEKGNEVVNGFGCACRTKLLYICHSGQTGATRIVSYPVLDMKKSLMSMTLVYDAQF